MGPVTELQKGMEAVRGRARWVRASRAALPAAVAYCALVLAARVAVAAGPIEVPVPGATAALCVLFCGAVWVMRPMSTLGVLQQIDRRLGLKSRLSTAFAIEGQNSGFASAVRAQAVLVLRQTRLSDALPLQFSRLTPAVATLGLTLALWPVGDPQSQSEHRRADGATPTSNAPLLSEDEREAFRLVSSQQDSRVAEYNALVTALANGQVSDEEGFAQLLALRASLGGGVPGADDAERIAARFKGAAGLDRLGQALSAGSVEDVVSAASELAERLAGLSAKERAEVLRALDAARREAQQMSEEAETSARRLLKRREEAQRDDAAERPRLLKRRSEENRQLDKLRREAQAQSERARRLSQLRRDLEDAQRALGQTGAAGQAENENMRRLAEALRRMAEQRAQNETESALERRLQTLQRMLQERRQPGGGQPGEGDTRQGGAQTGGQGGSGRGEANARLRRFTLQAGGQAPGRGARDGRAQGPGEQTQGGAAGRAGRPGAEGAPSGGGQGGSRPGERADTSPGGARGGQGAGGDRPRGTAQAGSDGSPGDAFRLGGSGRDGVLLLPGEARGGRGSGNDGPGAGDGHDTTRLDAPTSLGATARDVGVRGQRTAGRSRSEVIFDAASRGFATQAYGPVFEAYEGHAEEVIERDEVPPGYQFYVRRYFQLIRPRQGTTQ